MNASWRQDISLRLVALLLAVIIWFVVGRGGSPVALPRPEPQMNRELGVTIGFVGVPPSGIMAARPTVEPALVTVSGPVSKVERVSRVVALVDTGRIPDSVRMIRPYSTEVRLIPQDSEGAAVSNVRVEPRDASVTIWYGRPEIPSLESRRPWNSR